MENVLLIVLLLLALALTVVILMQRSEGGGLGMGGGGGGVVSGRSAANAMTKFTWILGAAFMAASLAMTVIAAQKSASRSVIDQIGVEAPASSAAPAGVPSGTDLLPPPAGGAPLTPPRAD